MDTTENEVLSLAPVSRKDFEELKDEFLKLKKKHAKTIKFVKILAEKEEIWCDDCEKVLDEYDLSKCDLYGCYNKICNEGHISFYDHWNGEVDFCSEYHCDEYKKEYSRSWKGTEYELSE